ncbi:MAG TPA: DUF4270 domain-containing protein [Flavobacteriales bacterium]|nr:DUF4270 domain-containing protein [Flavobacteriales bacterium]
MSIEKSEVCSAISIYFKAYKTPAIVNKWKAQHVGLFSVLALLLGLGCTKPAAIGLEVQPTSDVINGKFSDTTTLVAYTVPADSLRSDEAILSPLGSYIDPVFGYSTASFYVKFSMSTTNVTFGTGNGFTPDSLVMTIAYTGYYGDPPVAQTIMVYRLDSVTTIDGTATYYTNSDFQTDLIDLGGATINPASDDVVISFKLNDPIFIADTADLIFTDNTAFQSFLHGFYVVTDMFDPGGIHYLDINSSSTLLTLYYNDSMSFDFEIDGESAWTNRFHHNYDGTEIGAQLDDPSLGDSLVYVQASAGVMVKIEMPHITNWVKEQKIAVNKAELVLKVHDDGTLDTYTVPDNLFILGAGENTVVTDQFEGATHFGGTYDAANKTYSFNIARYVHELLYEGRSNDGLYLIVPNNLLTSGSVVSANRVVLGGPGHSTLGMKLNIIYTEL